MHSLGKATLGLAALLVLGCSKAKRPSTTLAAKSPEAPVIAGGLPPQEVGTGIRLKKDELVGCFQALRKKRPKAAGRIVVEFRVQGDTGRVTEAAILETTNGLADDAFRDCVRDAVKSIRYGKMLKDQHTHVIYPLRFPWE